MSNDLIDREKTIFFICDVLDRYRVDVDDKMANSLINSVKSQPTVYDVDKVVDQLESILEDVNIQLELSKDFQPKESESVKSNIVFFTERKRMCEEFMKIVKSGGIE